MDTNLTSKAQSERKRRNKKTLGAKRNLSERICGTWQAGSYNKSRRKSPCVARPSPCADRIRVGSIDRLEDRSAFRKQSTLFPYIRIHAAAICVSGDKTLYYVRIYDAGVVTIMLITAAHNYLAYNYLAGRYLHKYLESKSIATNIFFSKVFSGKGGNV